MPSRKIDDRIPATGGISLACLARESTDQDLVDTKDFIAAVRRGMNQRERTVLGMMTDGVPFSEMAKRMNVSEAWVYQIMCDIKVRMLKRAGLC
jgi:DNA-directed RNA polymerase specialized sigma subunit